MVCVKCGGEVWDNRQKKAAGQMKPNAPDFSCKNKDGCGWVQWPPKTKASPVAVAAPIAPPSPPSGPNPGIVGPSPRDTFLIELYWDSFDRVLEGLKKRALTGGFPGQEIAACVATLYIQRARG